MLSSLGTEKEPCHLRESHMVPESRYDRNEEEDVKTAIGYLYEFKKKLDKLHPTCIQLIDRMLQNQRHY